MDTNRRREPAASGEAIPGPKSPAADLLRQRACDLQEWRQRTVAVDIDYEFPRARHGWPAF
jgi:hypothetical protein